MCDVLLKYRHLERNFIRGLRIKEGNNYGPGSSVHLWRRRLRRDVSDFPLSILFSVQHTGTEKRIYSD